GHEHPSIRKECDRPRRVEVGDSLDGERTSGTCGLVAGVDTLSLGGAGENERGSQHRQCHECLVSGHVSSDFVRPSPCMGKSSGFSAYAMFTCSMPIGYQNLPQS